MHRFKDLQIWKRSRKFSLLIYKVTAEFPESKKFGLTNQLRRASVSIPSNIAEGSSRISNKDFFHFLRISIGSAYEIQTQLLIAYNLKFISSKNLDNLIHELESIIKMISKFLTSLKV